MELISVSIQCHRTGNAKCIQFINFFFLFWEASMRKIKLANRSGTWKNEQDFGYFLYWDQIPRIQQQSAKPYLRTWSRCMHVLLSSKKTITGQWGDWISPQGVRVGRRSNCAQGHAYIYILGVGCPKIHPGGCRLNNGIFRCSDVHGASRVYGAPLFY